MKQKNNLADTKKTPETSILQNVSNFILDNQIDVVLCLPIYRSE